MTARRPDLRPPPFRALLLPARWRCAGRAFPRILFSVLTPIAVCGVFATLLTLVTDVAPPTTAYLATSPGGVGPAAIIAASGDVDLPFVTAMQTTRFAIVLLVGPWLAQLVARRALLAGA